MKNQSSSSKGPEGIEITHLRVTGAERGWKNWQPLAALVGCKTDTISTAICKNFVGFDILKFKIERALGYEAIFSQPEEVRLRKKVSDATGMDPRLLHLSELRTLGKRLGARPDRQTNSSAIWRDAILRHAAVNKL